MKLIIDAQLPILLASVLSELGYNAFHVESLPINELFKTVNFVEINSNGIASHE